MPLERSALHWGASHTAAEHHTPLQSITRTSCLTIVQLFKPKISQLRGSILEKLLHHHRLAKPLGFVRLGLLSLFRLLLLLCLLLRLIFLRSPLRGLLRLGEPRSPLEPRSRALRGRGLRDEGCIEAIESLASIFCSF